MPSSTFEDRLARMKVQEAGPSAPAAPAKAPAAVVEDATESKSLLCAMLVFGALVGGTIGYLFDLRVGLLFVLEVPSQELYEVLSANLVAAGLTAGVLLAPLGFIAALMLSYRVPSAYYFWIGYLIAACGANYNGVIEVYETIAAIPLPGA